MIIVYIETPNAKNPDYFSGNEELTRIVQEDIKTLIQDGDVENIEDFKQKLTKADNVTRVESVEERKEQISEMRRYQKNIDEA